MRELYIGVMSGTSMDAVDAALVDLSDDSSVQLIATYSQPLPSKLRNDLIALCTPGDNEINRMGSLDIQVAEIFATTISHLLQKTDITAKEIRAIGSHGQTVRHEPHGKYPFTLQIGDPNVIAEKTGITTIADFRRRDLATGGQGAPLAPAFHNHAFRDKREDRIVLNIGGIANITWLPADQRLPVIGFDTGPGNTLLDAWINKHLHKTYDEDGKWAKSGNINFALLATLLADPYFKKAPPKSTGREYFNLDWLTSFLASSARSASSPLPSPAAGSASPPLPSLAAGSASPPLPSPAAGSASPPLPSPACGRGVGGEGADALLDLPYPPEDIQATLCELTAISIANAINKLIPGTCAILIGGGGIKNHHLIERLKINCPNYSIHSTEDFGIPPAWVEAMAFAWLAQQTLAKKPGNLPSVTGASNEVILGGIYNVN